MANAATSTTTPRPAATNKEIMINTSHHRFGNATELRAYWIGQSAKPNTDASSDQQPVQLLLLGQARHRVRCLLLTFQFLEALRDAALLGKSLLVGIFGSLGALFDVVCLVDKQLLGFKVHIASFQVQISLADTPVALPYATKVWRKFTNLTVPWLREASMLSLPGRGCIPEYATLDAKETLGAAHAFQMIFNGARRFAHRAGSQIRR